MPLQFITIPTEQTSAVTDLILAVQTMICLYHVRRNSKNREFAFALWSWVFGLLCVASLLGSIVHGFAWTPESLSLLWCPLYMMLALLVAFVSLASLSHYWNGRLGKQLLPVGFVIAIVFAMITQVWSDSFVLFVAYEAVMMTIAFILYIACFWRPGKQQGAGIMATGIFLTLVAAAVDTQSSWRFDFLWTFDNHGIFHLIQMMALLILTIGLCRVSGPISIGKPVHAKR